MNSKGFSLLIIFGAIVVVIILFAVVLTVPGQISRSHQSKAIGQELDGLQMPVTIKHKACGTGDGVDSGAQCSYIYDASPEVIARALKNAGYNGSINTYGSESSGDFHGGSPAILIQIHGDKSYTALSAEVDR